jgi:hypothetical protein
VFLFLCQDQITQSILRFFGVFDLPQTLCRPKPVFREQKWQEKMPIPRGQRKFLALWPVDFTFQSRKRDLAWRELRKLGDNF